MTDSLERTFQELRAHLTSEGGLAAPTHADPFFTFVHDPGETLELQRRLLRWRSILDRDGLKVEVHSLREIVWDVVEASGRWDDWLEAEEPGKYENINKSMRDVLLGVEANPAARPGLLQKLTGILADETPGRLVLLTDAALLHPWFRTDKIGTSLQGKIRCRTVLFYPGRRRAQYGLHFLDFHPEDNGSYRTTIVGGL